MWYKRFFILFMLWQTTNISFHLFIQPNDCMKYMHAHTHTYTQRHIHSLPFTRTKYDIIHVWRTIWIFIIYFTNLVHVFCCFVYMCYTHVCLLRIHIWFYIHSFTWDFNKCWIFTEQFKKHINITMIFIYVTNYAFGIFSSVSNDSENLCEQY